MLSRKCIIICISLGLSSNALSLAGIRKVSHSSTINGMSHVKVLGECILIKYTSCTTQPLQKQFFYISKLNKYFSDPMGRQYLGLAMSM